MRKKLLTFILAFLSSAALYAGTVTVEAESMTKGGQYAGQCSSPFNGVALYGNGDMATKTVDFTEGSGTYNVKITGASNNSTAAGVSLYVAGKKIAAVSFTGTEPSTEQVQVKLYFESSSAEVKLLLETDNGSNDTYVDKVEFEMVKPLVDRPAPTLPQQSVWQSGQYRNILQEAGYSQEEINSKLQAIKQQFFEGDAETGRLYYELGNDEAYILDTGNSDVRTESLSYGMMICVQLNMQEEFDKLWRFTKNHSMHKSGANKGYLAWQLNTDGSIKDGNAAPDGDEYIATALMFAAGRWGNNTTGIDYWKEANYILDNMLSKGHYINSSHVNMFNADHQIVFVPYAQSAVHTDPSYHMPAFYELWSKWANNNRQFWKACADKSRAMYPLFAHETTGLMPDYAEFSGGPRAGEHAGFRYDAWRCAMHMATDYMWFKGSENEYNQTKKLLDFFNGVGVKDYVALYELNGNPVYGADHSPGLVGCNAVGAMISDQKYAWDFVDDFFEMTFPTGHYRYYDGCLYFLSYLHASGNFKMYKPAEVLATAIDEQYKWDAENGYLIVDNFENVPEGKEYYMRSMDNSASAATPASDPKNATNHVLKIEPKSYDDYYYHEFRLPKEHSLSNGYTAIEFDVLYDGATYNNETMKVFLNDYSEAIYTESTGAKETQGEWKHVTAPVTDNTAGNAIVIGLGVRAGGGAYYIDNLKLKYTGTIEPGQTEEPGQGGNDPENNDPDNKDPENDSPEQGGGNDSQLTPETYPAGNILSEGAWGFENSDLNGWNSWASDFDKSVANTGYASDHCLKVENKTEAGMWAKQCVLALDNALEKGKTYTLTFKAKADVAANINTAITMKDDPWTTQGSANHSLTTEWAEYTFEQTIDMDNINRIVFNLGETATSYYIDNISLIAKAGEGEPDPTPGGNDDPTPGPTTDSRNGTYFTDNDVKYYMIEDFEDKTVGTTTAMQNNGGTATVSDEHKMEGDKALRVNIGAKYQGNGCYAIDVTLPEGVTLSDSKFSAINFDIYYEAGSIRWKGGDYNSGVKVWLNDINNMIIQHDTQDCLGKSENIAVPLEGKFTDTNSFKLLIGGLCSDNDNDGIYYIDNVRLVCKEETEEPGGEDDPTPGPTPGGDEGNDDGDTDYVVLEDFDSYEVDATPYVVENANGSSLAVQADPENEGKALKFITGSYKNNEYVKFDFTLPAGMTLSDYDVLSFDYRFFNNEGDGATYKDIKVAVNSTSSTVKSWSTQGNPPYTWATQSIDISSLEGGNTFTLYIGGINANHLRMMIDNIIIKKAGAGPAVFTKIAGTDISWNLNSETGVLTFKGTGDMPDYSGWWATPWHDAEGNRGCQETKVILPEGITSIGDACFDSNNLLADITIPSTVTKIGKNAFANCVSLNNLVIPENVQQIGDGAFNMTYGDNKIYTLKSIPALGNNSFNVNGKSVTLNLVLSDAEKPYITQSANLPTFASATYKRNVTAGYSTICLPFAVADLGSVTAYGLNKTAGDVVTFSKVTALEAGVPYLVETANITFTVDDPEITVQPQTSTAAGVAFAGVFQKKELTADDHAYGLKDGVFYLNATKMTTNPLRAYLYTTGAAQAKLQLNTISDDATGINEVQTSAAASDAVYDLMGRHQTHLQKGLNIISVRGGKAVKVIVK